MLTRQADLAPPHISIIPLALIVLGVHVLLAQAYGVVHPIDAVPEHLGVSDDNPPPGTPVVRMLPVGTGATETGAPVGARP